MFNRCALFLSALLTFSKSDSMLFPQVWKNRCAATDRRIGGHAALVLSRWDATRPPEVGNLVLLTQTEASRLENEGQGAFSSDVQKKISQRLKWAASVFIDEPSEISMLRNTGNSITNTQLLNNKNSCRIAVACTLGLFAMSLFYF